MSKVKWKTRKAFKAKFKVTGTGKLMRRCPGVRHKLTNKSSKRKRRLSRDVPVHEGQVKMYARLMGV